jgi:hypothetical protein
VLRGQKSIKQSKLLFAAVLFVASSAVSGESHSLTSGVQVEMSTQKPLTLHVTLRSHAQIPVSLYTFMLPWGNRNAMMLVPVTRDRECFDNKYLVADDSGHQKVSIEPNGYISGDIDLRRILPGLEAARKKSDIHLLWAYEAPEELEIGHWLGGWIFIPRAEQ